MDSANTPLLAALGIVAAGVLYLAVTQPRAADLTDVRPPRRRGR